MIGKILLKHTLKHVAGIAAAATSPMNMKALPGVCVLMYHRVAEESNIGSPLDNWSITPDRLENQFRWLAENAECVPLGEVIQKCVRKIQAKPVIALTFDDGFANMFHHVMPLLKRYGLCATCFVATRHVGSEEPYPFDQWGQMNHLRIPSISWRPITWTELEACLSSGSVSVGSHSHNHQNAACITDEQLVEEAMVSRETLRERLGDDAVSQYAYPYGSTRLGHVRAAYIEAVCNAGYRLAVTTDVGLARAGTPQFKIPRIEVHAYDSPWILKAKISGCLWPQHLWDRLRKARRHSSK